MPSEALLEERAYTQGHEVAGGVSKREGCVQKWLQMGVCVGTSGKKICISLGTGGRAPVGASMVAGIVLTGGSRESPCLPFRKERRRLEGDKPSHESVSYTHARRMGVGRGPGVWAYWVQQFFLFRDQVILGGDGHIEVKETLVWEMGCRPGAE